MESTESKLAPFLLGATGILITMSPATRLVTQGALSEPLFCAVALWLVIALAKFRSGGKWAPVVALSIAAGLLRFIGAPLAVLAGWERYQKTGRKLSSLMWTIAMMTLGFFAGSLYALIALHRSGNDWRRFWLGRHAS